MYNPNSDDDEKAGSSNRKQEGDRYEFLRKAKMNDLKEGFSEEREHYGAKRKISFDGRLSDSDEEGVVEEPIEKKPLSMAERMMAKMGYKEGQGLGKTGQGRAEPVALSTQRGRVGLGHEANKILARQIDETWDDSKEEKTVEEYPEWIRSCSDDDRQMIVENLQDDKWMIIREKKMKIEEETEFCDEDVLLEMLDAKKVFDNMNDRELREARARANPYETIGGAFFQNRAAMKTANLDTIYDYLFSAEIPEHLLKKNPLDNSKPVNADRNESLFYFADVCAGPGGFSEYMLWRKGFYNAKGFGFTLAGKDDFKLQKFCASSAFYFEPFYGTKENGDVMDPENIESLEKFVMDGTGNCGVHLMMADGGFSVEGQENLQEILSKRLYLCQLLVSLCIVRDGGNFFCKLFDVFTPFSAALIYLMRVCYQEVSLHKPHTSRPANSERYIICRNLRRDYSGPVRDYLKRVNRQMDMLKNRGDSKDVEEIVPLDLMRDDTAFNEYLVKHNIKLARRQTVYLQKYLTFSRNQGLFDKEQGNLREECLTYWRVPNRQRQRDREQMRRSINAQYVLGIYSKKLMGDRDFSVRSIEFSPAVFAQANEKHFKHGEYRFVRLAEKTQPLLLVATSDTVFIYNRQNWESVEKNLARIPENTILLVEKTPELFRSEKRIEKRPGNGLIRILDAAVLNGDDISALPFEQRMAAAEKFAQALRLVKREVKKGWGAREEKIKPHVLTVAKIYTTHELDEMRNEIEVMTFQNETHPMFVENEFLMVCRGLRFSRIINDHWQMGWSRSNAQMYAYPTNPRPGLGSVFEKEFEKNGVLASFWDMSMMKDSESKEVQRRLAADPRTATVMQCIWKWEASVQNTYGPRSIVTAESHEGGVTVTSLVELIKEIDASVHRV